MWSTCLFVMYSTGLEGVAITTTSRPTFPWRHGQDRIRYFYATKSIEYVRGRTIQHRYILQCWVRLQYNHYHWLSLFALFHLSVYYIHIGYSMQDYHFDNTIFPQISRDRSTLFNTLPISIHSHMRWYIAKLRGSNYFV